MEHLLQKSICSIFHNIFTHMTFQRRQKVPMQSKGLSEIRGFFKTDFVRKSVYPSLKLMGLIFLSPPHTFGSFLWNILIQKKDHTFTLQIDAKVQVHIYYRGTFDTYCEASLMNFLNKATRLLRLDVRTISVTTQNCISLNRRRNRSKLAVIL